MSLNRDWGELDLRLPTSGVYLAASTTKVARNGMIDREVNVMRPRLLRSSRVTNIGSQTEIAWK